MHAVRDVVLSRAVPRTPSGAHELECARQRERPEQQLAWCPRHDEHALERTPLRLLLHLAHLGRSVAVEQASCSCMHMRVLPRLKLACFALVHVLA